MRIKAIKQTKISLLTTDLLTSSTFGILYISGSKSSSDNYEEVFKVLSIKGADKSFILNFLFE